MIFWNLASIFVYLKFSSSILLIFKNNESIIFDRQKYDCFNFATLKILDAIVHERKSTTKKSRCFEAFLHNSLISISEFQNESDNINVNIYLKMEKSLFLQMIKDPDSIYEVSDIMQIIHSKMYLFSNFSKKITREIFYLFLTNQLSKEDIYKAYDKYILSESTKKTENHIFDYDSRPNNFENSQPTEDFFSNNHVDHDESESEKYNTCDSKSSLIYAKDFTKKIISSSQCCDFVHKQKNIKYPKSHPFNEYIKIFCDQAFFTFEFFFFDDNDILVVSMSVMNRMKLRNSIYISIAVFFESLNVLEKETDFEKQKNKDHSGNISCDKHPIRYNFLEQLKRKFRYPFIELESNSHEIMTFVDLLIKFIRPKHICLNITKFYSHLFSANWEKQNNLVMQYFNEFIQMILDKIYFVKLQIDTFSIKILKSRIFNIIDVEVISKASFTSSLHTSILCLKKISNSILKVISLTHLNTYMSEERKILNFFNYQNRYLKIVFILDRIRINDIHIKEPHQKSDIKHVNAIIEYRNCTIEVDKFDDNVTRRNVSLLNTEEHNQTAKFLHNTLISSENDNTSDAICKTNIVNKITSFRIFLLNFIRIKSRNKTSYIFLTYDSFSTLDIHNCSVCFLFRPPSSIQMINIKNSIISNSYSHEEMKKSICYQNKTDILIRQSYFYHNIFNGSFKKITIENCNKILRIRAYFDIIEISGVFEIIKILGHFYFHFRSKIYTTFLFDKNEKYLQAKDIIFEDDMFLSFIESYNLENCVI